ncbi:MAG: hypothetical protein ACRDPF_21660 [Streptosporangiaceae bacterium]
MDLLLWETEKRLIPDLDAIRSVTSQRPEAGKAARRAEAAHRARGLDTPSA